MDKSKSQSRAWRKIKLRSILDVKTGGTPSRKNSEYYINGIIPWIKTQELLDKSIYGSEEKITNEAIRKSNAKVFPIDTVLIAMYGATIGKLGILKNKAATNQACAALICKKDLCDYKFIFYSLLIKRRKLISLAYGAAQQNLNLERIKNFEINLPNVKEQQRITSILSTYDDLIEVNNKKIKNLEEMAQMIYNEWFVKFKFPGYEKTKFKNGIPEEWKQFKLGEMAEIKGGKQLERKEIRKEEKYPVFGGNGIQGYCDKTTHEKFVIIFGRVGVNCGSIHWVYNGAWLNNNSSSVNLEKYQEYILQFLINYNFSQLRGGAAQPFISNGVLANINILIPIDSLINDYCKIIQSMRIEQELLNEINKNLRKTRDLLLPRLMSRGIKV